MKELFKRLFFFLFKIVLALILISVLWVFAYRFVDPPISGMMVYKSLTIDNYSYEYEWVDLEEISANLPLAFIAAEDQLFLDHSGFDIDAIEKAIKHNGQSKSKRGASTISQQVAKNVFLVPTKSFIRKGLEAYFTLLIELIWDKKRIMEVYLNVVELGEGIYGVEKASSVIFKKSANKIKRTEAALIATALPNPLIFKLDNPSAYMQKRKRWVLKQMNNLGDELLLKDWYE